MLNCRNVQFFTSQFVLHCISIKQVPVNSACSAVENALNVIIKKQGSKSPSTTGVEAKFITG
jgi:hypothetical protein